MKTTKKGFTLIELIVVIAIIGVLAAILVPTMLGYVKKSKISSANSSASSVYKAINSTLTELDEEGIDVGGLWILTWNGTQWDCDLSADKTTTEQLGITLGAVSSGKKQFDNKVSNFFNDITKIKGAEAAIKGGSCVAVAVCTDKTYTGTYPGGIITTDSYEDYSRGTGDAGLINAVKASVAVASGEKKTSEVNASVANSKKLQFDDSITALTDADWNTLFTNAKAIPTT